MLDPSFVFFFKHSLMTQAPCETPKKEMTHSILQVRHLEAKGRLVITNSRNTHMHTRTSAHTHTHSQLVYVLGNGGMRVKKDE